jgi:hypothetical protein
MRHFTTTDPQSWLNLGLYSFAVGFIIAAVRDLVETLREPDQDQPYDHEKDGI